MDKKDLIVIRDKYLDEFNKENLIGDWRYMDIFRLRLCGLGKPNNLKKLIGSDADRSMLINQPLGDGTFEFLYSIIRETKPNLIVETGVQNGMSTECFLGALEKNNKGRLISIDCGSERGDGCSHKTWDRDPGKYVREEFKHQWELNIGISKNEIPKLVKKLKKDGEMIDLFHHDSDHSDENINFEIDSLLPFIRKGGVIAMHDAGDRFFNAERDGLITKPIKIDKLTVWIRN